MPTDRIEPAKNSSTKTTSPEERQQFSEYVLETVLKPNLAKQEEQTK